LLVRRRAVTGIWAARPTASRECQRPIAALDADADADVGPDVASDSMLSAATPRGSPSARRTRRATRLPATRQQDFDPRALASPCRGGRHQRLPTAGGRCRSTHPPFDDQRRTWDAARGTSWVRSGGFVHATDNRAIDGRPGGPCPSATSQDRVRIGAKRDEGTAPAGGRPPGGPATRGKYPGNERGVEIVISEPPATAERARRQASRADQLAPRRQLDGEVGVAWSIHPAPRLGLVRSCSAARARRSGRQKCWRVCRLAAPGSGAGAIDSCRQARPIRIQGRSGSPQL